MAVLDDSNIDARSDLDCSATNTIVHLVASGRSPVGAVLHAFCFGSAYNPFVRELPAVAPAPSPSIAMLQDGLFTIGVSGPGLFDFGSSPSPEELTPITKQTNPFVSGPDIALQPSGSNGLTISPLSMRPARGRLWYATASTITSPFVLDNDRHGRRFVARLRSCRRP